MFENAGAGDQRAIAVCVFMYKTELMQDISDIVDNYYSAHDVADAKVALWQNYGVKGHDALLRWEG